MLDATGTITKLIEVKDLKMHFPIYSGLFRRHVGDVKAVDGVSFDILHFCCGCHAFCFDFCSIGNPGLGIDPNTERIRPSAGPFGGEF